MSKNPFTTPEHYTIYHHLRDVLVILISVLTMLVLTSEIIPEVFTLLLGSNPEAFGHINTAPFPSAKIDIPLLGLFVFGLYFGIVRTEINNKFDLREQGNVIRLVILAALSIAVIGDIFYPTFRLNVILIAILLGLIVIWVLF